MLFFSDSLSVLQKLEEQNYTTNAIRNLAIEISSFIETFQIDLYLQWIPSHCGIPGNEIADTLAKKGASMLQPDRGVSQSTVKKILKSNKTIEWHKRRAQCDKGRAMFTYVSKPTEKK